MVPAILGEYGVCGVAWSVFFEWKENGPKRKALHFPMMECRLDMPEFGIWFGAPKILFREN